MKRRVLMLVALCAMTTTVFLSQEQQKPPFSVAKKTMDYGLSVKDVTSKKKNAFKLEFSVTSTVPVNVSMTDDRLVFEQVDEEEQPDGGKSVSAGKVLAVDVSKLGKRARKRMYKVPTWPLCAKPFEDKDKVEDTFRYLQAGNSFSSRGHTQDIAKLIFGERPIYVRDILLASKLVESGELQDFSSGSAIGGYLAGVAGQRLCFEGSVDEFQISLAYVRHFRKDDISVGIEIPFVIKKHNLKLTTTTSQMANSNDAFREKYDANFKAFVQDILCSKDSVLTERDTEKGIGDVSAFINFQLKSKHFERMFIGAKVLVPSAKERDIHKLWGPELGNGGFTELSAFGSVMFSHNNFFNPHVFAQAVYCLSADVTRRIPSYKSYTETSIQTNQLGEILAMGQLIRTIPGTTDFTLLDTTFRRFSTETQRVHIRKGAEFLIRVGNMFEKFISDHGFFDFYYDLRLKGRDYINTRNLACVFKPNILTQNTYQVEHRAGCTYSYQFDEHVRAMLGITYSFAGHNIPKTFEMNASFGVEF